MMQTAKATATSSTRTEVPSELNGTAAGHEMNGNANGKPNGVAVAASDWPQQR